MRNLYDFFQGLQENLSQTKVLQETSANTVRQCPLPAWSKAPGCPVSFLCAQSHLTNMPLSFSFTHTLTLQSAAALTKLVGHSLAPVLFSSASASATCSSARLPSVLVLWTSVGAGCNGLLQLQGSWAMLEIAVAGLTDATGLKQLLAWHWDPLVATAGTEHVTAVPAKEHGDVIWGTLTFFTPQVTMRPCGRFLENNTPFKTVYLNWTDVRSWVFFFLNKQKSFQGKK